MSASDELEYGKCDCEYPCSCFTFRGREYRDTDELIDELVAALDFEKGHEP